MKEWPRREKLSIFCLETLKYCILNKKFYPQSGHFVSKLGHFFPISEKGQGRPPPLPPLVTRLLFGLIYSINAKKTRKD